MHKMLVPVDGSEHALKSLQYLAFLGSKLRDPVEAVLLNVQPPVAQQESDRDGRPSLSRELEEPQQAAAAKILDAARAAADKARVKHVEHAVVGDAAPAVAEFARRHQCELIVMSTRGLGALQGLVMGSVATKVLHLADVPVLLVK